MARSGPLLSWSLLLLLALVWGSSFILIKKGLVDLTAGEVGALRILSAAVVLLPMALKNLRGLSSRQWWLLLVIGMTGSLIPAFLYAIAQTQLPSSVAGILNALTPMFTMLIGIVFYQQRMSSRTVTGLIIGLFGTAYLILAGSGSGLQGVNYYAFFVVLATIFYGINLNLIKFKTPQLTAKAITSVSLLLAAPFAAFYLFVIEGFGQKITPEYFSSIGAILILGVVGTAFALILFNELVKLTNPVFTSSVTYIIPLIAVLWGVIDGESLQLHHFVGMALIITGVFIANRKRTAVKQSVSGG